MTTHVRAYADALAAPDALTRCKAMALVALSAPAPASVAVCVALDRRRRASDAVELLEEPLIWDPARLVDEPDDPFSVGRARTQDIVCLRDLGAPLPNWLGELGFVDRVDVNLRSSGRLAARVSLLRSAPRGEFARHEIVALARIRETVELAYAAVSPVRAGSYAALRDAGLGEREAAVAELVGTGATNAEVASALNLGETTIKTYLARAYKKLGVHSRTELVGALARVTANAQSTDDLALRRRAAGLPARVMTL